MELRGVCVGGGGEASGWGPAHWELLPQQGVHPSVLLAQPSTAPGRVLFLHLPPSHAAGASVTCQFTTVSGIKAQIQSSLHKGNEDILIFFLIS